MGGRVGVAIVDKLTESIRKGLLTSGKTTKILQMLFSSSSFEVTNNLARPLFRNLPYRRTIFTVSTASKD